MRATTHNVTTGAALAPPAQKDLPTGRTALLDHHKEECIKNVIRLKGGVAGRGEGAGEVNIIE